MKPQDAKYRFDELMTTLSLLPDEPEGVDEGEIDTDAWVFPNLTRDLSEPEMYNAILCQSLKPTEDETVTFKLITVLANSAMVHINHIMQETDGEGKPTKDDLMAISIACNILWAKGGGLPLFNMMGLLGHICGKFELDLPTLATAFLRGNDGADKFGKLNPYDILEGKVKAEDVIALALDIDKTEVADKIKDIISEKDNE